MIAHNRDRPDEAPLDRRRARASRSSVAELDDEHDEARFVAGEIERLIDEDGLSRDEIAVFYRTNAQSRVLEDTLVRFELPYQVIGGTKFYERAEIKDAIAYLSLLVNPADQVSFARVVNSPRRGIGDTSQGRLARPRQHDRPDDLGGRAASPRRCPGWAPRRSSRSRASPRRSRSCARESEGGPVAELLRGAAASAPATSTRCEAERTIEAEGRIENLEELVGVAAEFDANREVEGASELPPLEEFLQADLALHRPGRPAARREPGHADDPAQRQGPRVRRGLHHRLRGGRLPALALARGGERGGGAAPLLRRHHPGPQAPLDDLRPRAAGCSAGARARLPLALPRRAARGAGRARGHRGAGAHRLGAGRRRRPRRRSAEPVARASRPATTSSTPASARAS